MLMVTMVAVVRASPKDIFTQTDGSGSLLRLWPILSERLNVSKVD